MKIEHNIILGEDSKIFQIPVILEFKDKLSNKEIEDLKVSASNGIAMLYSSGQLIKHKNNLLLNSEKKIYPPINLDKIGGEIEDIDFEEIQKKQKPLKTIKYKIFSRE